MRESENIAGRRVRHDEMGYEGVVTVEPSSSASLVYVLFDGDSHPTPCHPDSVEFIERSER